MSDISIRPAKHLKGVIQLPGDKSISHRALLFSAIANGTSTITGLSDAEDVLNTKKCLQKLGVSFRKRGTKTTVRGVGMYGLKESTKTLNVGNSGTTIRLLSGVLAAQPFTSIIDGDSSLRNRPMRRIIEPLEEMGAAIESTALKAPLKIKGGPLRAIDYASPVASAQVKSCILLAGLYAKGTTRITEPAQSRDHTERMLEEYGAQIHDSPGMAAVVGPVEFEPRDIDIPGDVSAAAFFLIASCLLPGSDLLISNVGINPTRTGFIDALAAMHAFVHKQNPRTINNEPRADLNVKPTRLKSTILGGFMIPRIIDEIPILAVAATQAEGTSVIRDAAELRVKESDRIATMHLNLKRMGADVRETADGLVITGPTKLKGAEIDSYADHRIAMSFAVAGLLAEGETVIRDVECVNTSFPGFFELLESIRHD